MLEDGLLPSESIRAAGNQLIGKGIQHLAARVLLST